MNCRAFVLLSICLVGNVLAGEPNWLTSVPEALNQARSEGKIVLLDFTGSDWCGWCKRLDAEVFSQPEFIAYANQNLVFVQVDFPRGKPQSDELKKANHALQKKYDVEGFPTVIVLGPDGSKVWERRGYVQSGPRSIINSLNQSRTRAGLPILATAPKTPAPAPPPTSPPAPAPLPPAIAAALAQQRLPQAKPQPGPKLQAILYSATHSAAVLDGHTCEEGERVHGMRIVKITRDEVMVEAEGKTNVLTLN